MKYIPYETITLGTKLTEEEIINRLSNYIEPEDFFGFRLVTNKKRERPYEGKINNRKFRIKRITYFRRDIPVIIGDSENHFDQTIINFTIRPPISHIVASCLAYSFFGFHFIINFLIEPFGFITLFLFGMIVFGYIVALYRFNAESTKAKIDLQQLFEATERNGKIGI